MKTPLSCALLFGMSIASLPTARGEAVPAPANAVFASFGLGQGSRGIAGVLSLNVDRGRRAYILRVASTSEFTFFGRAPDEENDDYAFLVGRRGGTGSHHYSAAVGLGVVRTIRRGAELRPPDWFFGGRYERLEHYAPGITVDLAAGLNAHGIGVGLDVFGDVNEGASFVGLALTIQVGKLR
jgi:hypothetical protein